MTENGAPLYSIQRNTGLDFLRGLAILLVLCAHYTFPISGIAPLDAATPILKEIGGVGVDLFFTLSGFLVGGLLLQEYKKTGALRPVRFLVRRAFKIWPPLYVLVLFHVIAGRHPIETFLWQNLFHVQNYYGTSIAQTWSLAVEEHFYLLLALLMWAMVGKSPKSIGTIIVAACFASIAARWAIVHAGNLDAAFRQTQYRMDSLLYGVLLALIRTFYPNVFDAIAEKTGVLITVVAALITWIVLARHNPTLERYIGYTIQGIGFCASVILLHEHSSRIAQQSWFKLVAWIGIHSYGIYLWHSLALEPGRQLITTLSGLALPPPITFLFAVAAQFSVGICAGFVMTKTVEWPLLRLRDKVFPAEVGATLPRVTHLAGRPGGR